MPLILKQDNQKIEALGLVDSGATVNVLPYDIGLQLGGNWDDRKAIIKLAGNLGNQTAIPFTAIVYVGEYSPTELVDLLGYNWDTEDNNGKDSPFPKKC